MTLDALAIAAHRDDVEQTCGGTLLKMAEQGYRAGVLDLTAGEMGTRGTPEQRAREAEEAARILRLHWRENLGLPDARVENTWENRLLIAARIRQLRPQIVFLPYWQGRHPDHCATGALGYEACFLAGLKKLPLEGQPHRPHKILYSTLYYDVRPSFVVDITDQFERRLQALLAYRSQYADQAEGNELFGSEAEVRQRVETLARYYGMMVGARYGEPFLLRETMLVADPIAEVCRGRPSV